MVKLVLVPMLSRSGSVRLPPEIARKTAFDRDRFTLISRVRTEWIRWKLKIASCLLGALLFKRTWTSRLQEKHAKFALMRTTKIVVASSIRMVT